MSGKDELLTVVSVCKSEDFDWQSAIEFKFQDIEEAMQFVRLVLSQGLTCLVSDRFEKEVV